MEETLKGAVPKKSWSWENIRDSVVKFTEVGLERIANEKKQRKDYEQAIGAAKQILTMYSEKAKHNLG